MLDHFSLFDWKSQVLEVFKEHVMFYGTKCPSAKSQETSSWLLFLSEIVIFIHKFMFAENRNSTGEVRVTGKQEACENVRAGPPFHLQQRSMTKKSFLA